jgi:hypothetical protein
MSYPSDFGPPNPYRPSATKPPDWAASPYGPYPPPRRSSGCFWALLAGGILGASLLCCGACGGLVFFGLELIEDEIADSLKDDPVIQEHLGEVSSVELNMWESLREEMKNPTEADEESWMAFDVKGSKGSGRVVGKSVTNPETDLEELKEGRLRLPDGRELPLSQ